MQSRAGDFVSIVTIARRDRHFLHAGNHPERANAPQAPAPLGANLRPFCRHADWGAEGSALTELIADGFAFCAPACTEPCAGDQKLEAHPAPSKGSSSSYKFRDQCVTIVIRKIGGTARDTPLVRLQEPRPCARLDARYMVTGNSSCAHKVLFLLGWLRIYLV
jgi:hypothetical protein